MRPARDAAIVFVILTTLLLVGWDVLPDSLPALLDIYALAMASVASWALVRTLTGVYPVWGRTEFDRAFLSPPERLVELEELERIRRAVAFARFTAMDIHTRLRPLVREIADAHLAAHYGRGLDADPDDLRARLPGPRQDAMARSFARVTTLDFNAFSSHRT
jgi:hypothetical protein